jgi:DnaJ-domain-containing protein 1
MYQQMFQDLERLPQKWVIDFQVEINKWTQDLLRDAFDPSRMTEFLRGMGIDMSWFSQMFGGMVGSGTVPQGFDPYRILGLDKSATDEEIKKRYRELLHKLHPDTAGIEGTSFLLQMVLAAYEMIKRERGWN